MRATLRRCQRCKCGVGLERGGHPEQEKLVNDTTSTLAGRARGSGGRAPPEGPPSTRRLARGTARSALQRSAATMNPVGAPVSDGPHSAELAPGPVRGLQLRGAHEAKEFLNLVN